MLKVVFTGPAINGAGQSILRANLIKACQKKGMTVQSSMQSDTQMLVASRTDTVKAKKAQARGIPTCTYPVFLKQFMRGVDIEAGGVPNKYTDAVSLDLLVPDFTDNSQLALADVL